MWKLIEYSKVKVPCVLLIKCGIGTVVCFALVVFLLLKADCTCDIIFCGSLNMYVKSGGCVRMFFGYLFIHLLLGCCSIKSPVDEKQMDGIPSVKIHSGTDYISNSHLIRWTEVFILQVREEEVDP